MMFERTISSVWMISKVSTAACLDFRKLKPVLICFVFYEMPCG